MTAKLTTHEPGNDRTFEVTESGLTIGRHADNQASLDDSRLSRFHARIKCKDGEWYAEDLGSTNGSFINDKRFEGEVKIARGDKLRFGATDAELVWEGAAAAPAPAAASQNAAAPAEQKAVTEVASLKTAATIVAPLSSLMKELPDAAKPAAITPVAPEAPAAASPIKPLVITPASPEEAASLDGLTPVEPAAGGQPASPLKPAAKPLIRKPVIGGLKPGLKLPPKPAGLKPGLKLPPKPTGLKPGVKLPPKTSFQLKPGLKLPPKPDADPAK